MNQAETETLDQLLASPVSIEFLEDRSLMKSNLCVFDYDKEKHLGLSYLELCRGK